MVKNDVAKRTEKINATQTIDTSDLVKKADCDTKIVENENFQQVTMINIILLMILIHFWV